MRKSIMIIAAVLAVAITIPAFAELQNVQVGGAVRIRGNWVSDGNNLGNDDDVAFVEQRTRVNVKADMTDMVSVYIELDSYGDWGTDFRSNYLTGVDGPGAADADVYQGYIEVNEMWGSALRARIGRQEILLGSEWLVGNNSTGSLFTGLSFDAIRLTYATDQVSLDAIYAKLVERSAVEEDGDLDMYALYASYLGIEDVTLDAYWLYIRDATDKQIILRLAPWWLGGPRLVTVGDTLDTHTFGLRGAGTLGAFDFEAEAAYQYLELDDLDSNAWAANLEVGYTFDTSITPRIFLGGAYFEGADVDENDHCPLAFWHWFDDDDSTLAFNRLFSDKEYTPILDTMSNLTGFWAVNAGVSLMPTESLKLALVAAYIGDDNELNNINRRWWHHHHDNNDEIGWEVDLSALYNYTEDLSFEVGYSHLFTNEDSRTLPLDDDIDYVYVETKLCF